MKVISQALISKVIEGLTQDNLKNKILELLIKNKLKFYQVIFLCHNLKNQVFLLNKIKIQMKLCINRNKIINKFLLKLIPKKIIKTEFIHLIIGDQSPKMKFKQINLIKNSKIKKILLILVLREMKIIY